MSWIWPKVRIEDANFVVRAGRLLHWVAVGLSVFGIVVSFVGMIEAGDREPIPYVAVGLVWIGLALFGRGLRYLIAKE